MKARSANQRTLKATGGLRFGGTRRAVKVYVDEVDFFAARQRAIDRGITISGEVRRLLTAARTSPVTPEVAP